MKARSLIGNLTASMGRAHGKKAAKNDNTFPPEFKGTMILHPRSLSEMMRSNEVIDPVQCFVAPVMVWLPELYFNNDPNLSKYGCCPCPRCGFTEGVCANGLTESCRIIVGREYSYYMFGRKYICAKCKDYQKHKTKHPITQEEINSYQFTSYDSNVLSKLPHHIAREFKFLRTGVDCITVHLVHVCDYILYIHL
jgi:hypothetical protein